MRSLVVAALLLAACAKQEAAAPAPGPKGLESHWVSPGTPAWTMDFPDSSHVVWTYGTGGSCRSDFSLQWSGDQDEGTMVVSGSVAVDSVPGMPNCSQFDGSWTYNVLADSALVLCQAQCVVFR